MDAPAENPLTQIRTLLSGGSRRVQAAAAISLLALVGVGAWIVFEARSPEMSLLYAELAPQDASKVVEHLKQNGIPYRLSDGGQTIYAPRSRVSELRLDLLVDGAVGGRGTGLELFERGTFGQSAFAEQVTYTRALQGELARTIGGLDPVAAAQVHLGRPRQSAFLREAQAPTASVVLRLRPGRTLSGRQLAGVRALVAASVPRLEAASVSVLDQSGAVLGGGAPGGQESGPGYERERSLEQHLVQKAQSLLNEAYGPGRAIVRVNVSLNRTAVEERKEELARQGVPTEENVTTKTKTRARPGAATAGVAGNVPGAGAASQPLESETEEVERTQYALGRSTRLSKTPAGGLERLTIGVLLDASLQEHQEEIGTIVKESLGFDPKRGDAFQISALAFERPEEQLEGQDPRTLATVERLIRSSVSLVLVLAGLSVVVFLTGKGRRHATSGESSEALAAAATAPVRAAHSEPRAPRPARGESDEQPALQPTPEPVAPADPLSETVALIHANPLGAGVVLERWLGADQEGEDA